jgi:alpha-galactosidase
MASEWVYIEPADLQSDDPLANYTTAVARQMNARVPTSVATGWCSWYYFFQKVREQDMLANLDAITQARAELPFEVVQLDDGFESDVGDWLSINEKFPHGLTWLAGRVKERGFTPGLWLAPFIVKPTARLESEHPEWLLKGSRGLPVSSGYNWWQWTHALDVTHPGAQDYVRQVIGTAVREWGFPYLKLDFLYAAALPGRRHDPTTTRAQALRKGLELIRETAGEETFLLGCGCPIGPGVGIFDANRIGPDVAPNWRPRAFGTEIIFGQEPGMPAARNAIRNTLVRSAMHGRWWHNDPDCLLVRSNSESEDEARLTEDEVCSLASVIGLSGGLVLSSDDLPSLPPERRRYIAALLPPFGQSAKPLDLMESELPELYVLRMQRDWGQWIVAGLFNWGDTPARRVLDLARLGLEASRHYDVFDFWNERYYRVSGGQLAFESVAPHSGHVLGVRPASDEPHVIATTFHITMG